MVIWSFSPHIQEEGMGLFQLVRPFITAAVVAISGMPVAIATGSGKAAFPAGESGRFSGGFHHGRNGLPCRAVPGWAGFLRTRARQRGLPYLVVLKFVFFWLCAAGRGHFQGLQYMVPSATSLWIRWYVELRARNGCRFTDRLCGRGTA